MSEGDQSQTQGITDTQQLRFNFVGMFFAVAAGEVGFRLVEMSKYLPEPPHQAHRLFYMLPAIAHLFLAMMLIATSWVGYSSSKTNLDIRDAKAVFSWPFIVLFFDTSLVLFYFILTDNVEVEVRDLANGGKALIVDPSAGPATFWMLMIFIGYFLWDFVTKALIDFKVPGLCGRLTNFWMRGRISLFCMFLAFLQWWFLADIRNFWGVILTDLCLVALVLAFRAFKQFDPKKAAGFLFVVIFVALGVCARWAPMPGWVP